MHQRFEQKILRDLKKISGSATLENKKLDFSAENRLFSKSQIRQKMLTFYFLMLRRRYFFLNCVKFFARNAGAHENIKKTLFLTKKVDFSVDF